ncbi:hypothetical protein VTN77DRAFT_5863 [Rasamsonia byssochlamydoides]|uniref:uncharacterized protein n=1 Tax=Rasamsonia byssochlamydoides TaxID=89139 RepID=UPI003743D704
MPIHTAHFSQFPGITIYRGELPIYIPAGSENPGWPRPDPKFESNDVLQTVLETARELGDYQVEAMCLEELICRADDPKVLFTQLGRLQKSIQGDGVRYRQTCLSRYLLATDAESRRDLIEELEQSTHKSRIAAEDDAFVLTRWSEFMVRRALCCSLPGYASKLDRTQAIAESLIENLPTDILHSLSHSSFFGNGVSVFKLERAARSVHGGDGRVQFDASAGRARSPISTPSDDRVPRWEREQHRHYGDDFPERLRRKYGLG